MSKAKKSNEELAAMFQAPGVEPGSDQPEEKPPQPIQVTDSMIANVEASDIVGNSECIFTEGCRGRIYTYNTVKVRVVEGDRETHETRQQLRCNACGKIAKGYRVVGLPGGSRKLFDRHQKQ